ncbi:MAG: PA2169 family four-helix-bundle protein [Bacteroidia bacterium]
MGNNDEKTVSLLNSLIEINNDRIEGYDKANSEVENHELKALFARLADESRQHRSELISEVVNNGGAPTEGNTLAGKFFRAWMDIKTALTNHDMKAVIRLCEFGEDAALEVYDNVLNDNDLPFHARGFVIRQRTVLQKSHDHIKRLRDGVKETH